MNQKESAYSEPHLAKSNPYENYLATVHRWATICGSSELLPALPQTAEFRTKSLEGISWLGDTPSRFSLSGIAYRIQGWVEMAPTANEVRQWATAQDNILCQHRWLRGIRLHGADGLARYTELQRRVEDFTQEEFKPPYVQNPEGSVTFMVETPITLLSTQHAPRASLVGCGATTVVAGVDASGRAYRSWVDHNAWGAPQISAALFSHLWSLASGLPALKLPDLRAATARVVTLFQDPVACEIEANGWAVGFRKEGMDVRCPFHLDAFTPALYTPAPSARGKPRIVCPLCPRHTQLDVYLEAMGCDTLLMIKSGKALCKNAKTDFIFLNGRSRA